MTELEIEQEAQIIVKHVSQEAIEADWKVWDENWTNESFYTIPSSYYVIKKAKELGDRL